MAEKIILQLDVDAEKGMATVGNLEDSVEGVGEGAEKSSEAMTGLTAKLDQMTGGAITAFKSIVTGAKSGVAAMNGLRVAIAATGIGALLLAITALTQYFSRTEKGAQQLRVIMAALGQVVDTLADSLVVMGEYIADVFTGNTNPVKDFANTLQEFIGNAVANIIDGFGLLGESLTALFEGDFTKAAETAKEGAIKLADGFTDLNPATAIIKQTTGALIDLGTEVNKDVRSMIDLENRLNDVKVAERELTVERSRSRAEIEELRNIGQDVTRTTQERTEALQRAADIETDLLAKETRLAQERLAIQRETNELSASSEEDLQAVADLEARTSDLEAQASRKKREILTQLNTLTQQEVKARQDALDKIEKATLTANEKEIADVREKYAELIRLAEKYGEDTKALKQKLTQELNALEPNTIAARGLTTKDISERLEKERTLAMGRLQVRVESNARQNELEAQSQAKNLQLAEEERNAKLNIAQNLAGSLSQLLGQQTAAGKAAAIAAATISTYQGAAKTIAQYGATPLGIAGVAAAIANGFLQVKRILDVEVPGGGGGSSGSTNVRRPPSAGSSIGLINPVGQSNNIGESLGQSLGNQPPIKAYVTAGEVADGLDLENKIRSNGQFE